MGENQTNGFEVVRGNFSRDFLHVGYNKIAEIPAGACNISVQETKKSRNYLALQTRSGISIINGNWVIDRPGTYFALGTQLIYKRPNEIRSWNGESITAPGPLTDDLHLYLIYQQPGPSVHYEYSIPIIIHSSPEPDTPDIMPPDDTEAQLDGDERINTEAIVNSITVKEKSHSKKDSFDASINFVSQSTYVWTKTGHSGCSTTCGTGTRAVFWECVDSDSQMTVPADFCDLSNEPTNQEDCNEYPCPPYWDIGEWSECSRKCGPGSQMRQVICRQVTRVHDNRTETSVAVAPEQCGMSGRPMTQSTCQLKICSHWEIRSDWSPCSVPCGVGQRSREVVCVSNQGVVDDEQECNMSLKPDFLQNCDMGVCARSWFTSLWSQRCSAECGRGNKTRSIVCLSNRGTDLPLDGCEGDRPPAVTSCDAGPCQNQLEWYTGPWSQCSAECGDGIQTRSALCIFTNNGLQEVVDQFKCSGLSKPITSQPCRLKPCGVQWYVTEWSACSRSCNSGYRVREVRCLTDDIVPSDDCHPISIPESREECNKQTCLTETNPHCSDQFHNCVLVVQARLCVYPYYTRVCCTSCSRTQRTYPMSIQRKRIRR
uniref:ADAMTS-like 7 n=1 Tax=Oryzias latipes TaxID=8090 RepID=A0A3P9H6M9_ORYLA